MVDKRPINQRKMIEINIYPIDVYWFVENEVCSFDSNLAQGHMDGDRPDGIPIVWLDIPFQVSITDHSSSKSVMSKFRAASCYTQFCLVFQGFTWLIKITYFASLSWCWGSHGGFSPCHCKG
ncbi:hypothetical protein CRG98_007107 [Punica granatum]|uniref:Uncharacterized protein n=1 Tax=Punica granatum TaxID=22663 RepID=A0A2I0KVK7_PUNGR|nr:hypothetical protein CRG98_007107 [Punica granatum]